MTALNDGRVWVRQAALSRPWLVYTYGRTHDRWRPLRTSTRIRGRALIGLDCAVCGDALVAKVRLPRFRRVVPKGNHAVRDAFLAAHQHPDAGHPMSWKVPLLNPHAHPGGLNLDLLAMRMQADLTEPTPNA